MSQNAASNQESRDVEDWAANARMAEEHWERCLKRAAWALTSAPASRSAQDQLSDLLYDLVCWVIVRDEVNFEIALEDARSRVAADKERFATVVLEEIAEAAKRIDPRTAMMVWWYVELADPYDLGLDIPPLARQSGREYFLVDLSDRVPVLVGDVRKLHPEIPDETWEQLMKAARKRDESWDHCPRFHRYG